MQLYAHGNVVTVKMTYLRFEKQVWYGISCGIGDSTITRLRGCLLNCKTV